MEEGKEGRSVRQHKERISGRSLSPSLPPSLPSFFPPSLLQALFLTPSAASSLSCVSLARSAASDEVVEALAQTAGTSLRRLDLNSNGREGGREGGTGVGQASQSLTHGHNCHIITSNVSSHGHTCHIITSNVSSHGHTCHIITSNVSSHGHTCHIITSKFQSQGV